MEGRTRQQLAKVDIANIVVGSSEVTPVSSVRILEAWFDSELYPFCIFICTISSALGNICQLKLLKYLCMHSSLVGDYCNSLLYGLPSHQLNKLPRVQNGAARVH